MKQTITTVNVANTPSIITSAGTALASGSPCSRAGWQIQNVGTNPLFVLLGSGASNTVYHFILKGGTGDNDGLGASFSQFGPCVYQGIVTVAGTSPKFVVLEMSDNAS